MLRKSSTRFARFHLVAGAALLLLPLSACTALKRQHDPQLTAQLRAILQRCAATGASVSARVIELDTGRELFAENIDAPLMPASNMKLITAAVALDTFGPAHTFDTYLAFDGEDLWVEGTGDPALGDEKIARAHGGITTTVLTEWSQALRDRGVTHIPGAIRCWDGALDNEHIHSTWGEDDLLYWYAAPVSGLNFNDNCVDLTVFPTSAGNPAGFTLSPRVHTVTVLNECVSGAEAPPSLDRMPHADVLVLGGGCRKRRTLPSKPVLDPGAFLAEALRENLASNGIPLAGEIQAESEPLGGRLPPPTEQLIATHRSTMADVLWRTLKSSQNLFADCLCKLNGQAYDRRHGLDRPGSWSSGERAARAFMRVYGIADAPYVGADGSGLSRDNRITVRLISDLLVAMHTHPHAQAFRAALAEPGSEGTLANRMPELKGRVHAKTGYIRGVRALSGYVLTQRNRWFCFSIIYNGIPGSVAPFNAMQDDACRLLVNWPDLPASTATSADVPAD